MNDYRFAIEFSYKPTPEDIVNQTQQPPQGSVKEAMSYFQETRHVHQKCKERSYTK